MKNIREHTGYQAYACLMFDWAERESPEMVDKCVAVHFDGDWKAFETEADAFLENAYGVDG
jgi:hypothetical protein